MINRANEHPASFAKNIFKEEKLRHIFHDYMIDSAVRGLDGQQARQLLEVNPTFIQDLSSHLNSEKPYKFTPYRQILKAKGSHSPPRVISVPSVRDRIILKAISLHLNEVFVDRRPEIAPRKIHRISRAMDNADFYDSFIRLDIMEFYPSISHLRLMQKVRDRGIDSYVASLILEAVKNPTVAQGRRSLMADSRNAKKNVGVPQGLSISNILAETFMSQIDKSSKEIPDIWYERYVDDILVLCNQASLNDAEDLIVGKIQREDLTVHAYGDASKRAAGSIQNGFAYLGYEYRHGLVSVRQSSVDSLYSSLSRVFTQYKYALQRPRRGFKADERWRNRCQKILVWRLCLHIEGCILNGQRRGWINYFSQLTDMSLLGSLDAFVQAQMRTHKVNPSFLSEITPKGVPKFRQALWRTRYSESRESSFVFNFDDMNTRQQKTILNTVFFYSHGHIGSLDDADISSLFRKRVEGVAKDLENDLGTFY